MAEKIDLGALGPHFHNKLAAHREEHESKTLVEAERRRKLADLQVKLQFVARAEGLRESRREVTKTYPVEKLDNGTEVAASLGNGHGRRLFDTANEFLRSGTDLNERYIRQGPQSEIMASNPILDEAGFKGRQQLINVYARLETAEGGHTTTTDGVLVGSIEDPETIIVPEPNPDSNSNDNPVYRFIGPDDSRFAPIMAMAEHVSEQIGEWGEKPHVG